MGRINSPFLCASTTLSIASANASLLLIFSCLQAQWVAWDLMPRAVKSLWQRLQVILAVDADDCTYVHLLLVEGIMVIWDTDNRATMTEVWRGEGTEEKEEERYLSARLLTYQFKCLATASRPVASEITMTAWCLGTHCPYGECLVTALLSLERLPVM